jgi:hypothetical protein
MTQDEIIEMAREAGLVDWESSAYRNELQAFAKLVAAKEREKCAEIAKWHREMAHEIRRRGQT